MSHFTSFLEYLQLHFWAGTWDAAPRIQRPTCCPVTSMVLRANYLSSSALPGPPALASYPPRPSLPTHWVRRCGAKSGCTGRIQSHVPGMLGVTILRAWGGESSFARLRLMRKPLWSPDLLSMMLLTWFVRKQTLGGRSSQCHT